MKLERLDLATAKEVLDFSGGDSNLKSLGELQLKGAVALHNMIATPKVGLGYLADEVGMGKTYIALGVVSLMRYFNPTLRVLYICPSANVQEKWYEREYINFARSNVKVSHFRVRTIDGRPAAPRISCHNVSELIHSASLGYFSDFFVRNNLFSINLGDKEDTWDRKLKELKDLLPAWFIRKAKDKKDVKDQYAEALNYVLPNFDLVVIDEAHNFKHDFKSSARNSVLSKMLGFRTDGNDAICQRVKHALLLSATPYDRDLEQLRNQLKLVGKGELLPEKLSDDKSQREKEIRESLSKFMVRRLNTLEINGKKHTRNMYRHEARSGEGAEIRLESDEQKLITALVQKKVLKMLDEKGDKGDKPSFQMGMLASFESFADSSTGKATGPVEFDSDSSEKDNKDAEDRHIIGSISGSYIEAGLGGTLPHPKMDEISKQLNDIVFTGGKKHIVFVRRIKSVKELKHKLDDYYNQWIFAHLENNLRGESAWDSHPINRVISKYKEVSRDRDDDISEGEYQGGGSDEDIPEDKHQEEERGEVISEDNNQIVKSGDAEDKQRSRNDTIFTWFFRGELPKETKENLALDDNFTYPETLRESLLDKEDANLLEVNWALAICSKIKQLDLDEICEQHGWEIASLAQKYTSGDNNLFRKRFHASQFGFLEWCKKEKHLPNIEKIIDCFFPSQGQEGSKLSVKDVVDNLQTWTLFDAMREKGLLTDLFPLLGEILDGNKEEGKDEELLRKLDVHIHLLSMCLRTGHGFIDLYISRLQQGEVPLTKDFRRSWMDDFADRLKKQSQGKDFNTYQELSGLSKHLDLIIKTNLSDVHQKSRNVYRRYFSKMLNPVAPVVGATGATSSGRSAQARKFRMPGYPLILISTNVFQEGEDLHTFCDSVLHYGLSSSPVSIEQKTGRVDRVGSQAQRRLLKLDTSPNKDQLIQVSFPFVRESIEALQVRQLCKNVNEFIESLHDIGSQRNAAEKDKVNAPDELNDRSPILEQIRDELKSPYDPDTSKVEGECRVKEVKEQGEAAKRIEDNIDSLLKKHFKCEESILKRGKVSLPGANSGKVSVELRSARASGEMLLRAKYIEAENKELRDLTIKDSWHTFHRIYVEKTAKGRFDLYHDAEILIGDEQGTTSDEIEMFFNRFLQDKHNPNEYKRPVSDHIIGYWKQANEARYGQWLAEIKPFENEQHLGLNFAFGDEENQQKREHKVRIYEAADRCIFMAQVADAKTTKKLNQEQLVRFTWERNANIDIVEFMLDDKENLVGRAVHPIRRLDEKEFLYCAYTLAVSADRLEYLIGQSDEN